MNILQYIITSQKKLFLNRNFLMKVDNMRFMELIIPQ